MINVTTFSSWYYLNKKIKASFLESQLRSTSLPSQSHLSRRRFHFLISNQLSSFYSSLESRYSDQIERKNVLLISLKNALTIRNKPIPIPIPKPIQKPIPKAKMFQHNIRFLKLLKSFFKF
jgi:hypothetical protein